MIRIMASITLLTLFGLLVGCGVGRPAIPPTIKHPTVLYTTDELEKHRCLFEEAVTGLDCKTHTITKMKDPEMARFWRDTMIGLIRRDVESYYREYETNLADSRRRFGTTIDVASLAGVAAATITNGARAKTVISTMVAFVQGAHGKIDQNIFRERTTDVIIQKMRASRAKVETVIVSKTAQLDALQYIFSDAERDLRELFWAGTLQGGFLELALSAGNDAATATQQRNQTEARVRGLLPQVTQTEANLLKKIDDEIVRLTRRFSDGTLSENDRKKALEPVLKALKALEAAGKHKFTGALPDNDGSKLFKLLRDEVKDSLLSPGGLQEKLPIIARALDVN